MEKAIILSYSAKALVVTGNTRPIKDRLKSLGGAWNSRLTNPNTGERIMGWIFAKHKLDKVTLICTDAAHEGIIGGVDIPTPENIHQSNTGDYLPDPGEVAADNWAQNQPGL